MIVKVILEKPKVIKEVKFLLFYLLLINLDLSYFLGKIHIYKMRER